MTERRYKGFDALKALSQGKRLRNSAWATSCYIVRKGESICWNTGMRYPFDWDAVYLVWEEPKAQAIGEQRVGPLGFFIRENMLNLDDVGNAVKLRNSSFGLVTASYPATPGLHPVDKFWVNQNLYDGRGTPLVTVGNKDIEITHIKRDGKWYELSKGTRN